MITTRLGLHAYAVLQPGHATAGPYREHAPVATRWSTPVWSSLAWCLGPCLRLPSPPAALDASHHQLSLWDLPPL